MMLTTWDLVQMTGATFAIGFALGFLLGGRLAAKIVLRQMRETR
jgi:uncharacterized membrane protein YciS (DUF1049 family)